MVLSDRRAEQRPGWMCPGCRRHCGRGPEMLWSSEPGPAWGWAAGRQLCQRAGHLVECKGTPLTYWNFCRTDLAKLLIFYKDLNQRSIMESPANSVSSSLRDCPGSAHVPICLASRSRVRPWGSSLR